MISRPIVASGIIGILFGNITYALMAGIVFEFIGMLEVPVGTTVTHDDTFGGYAASVLIASNAIPMSAISVLACIFVTSLIMYPVTESDKIYRKINKYLLDKNIKNNESGGESRLIFIGIIIAFVRGAVFYNAGLFAVLFLVKIIGNIENMENSALYDEPVIALTIIAMFMGGYLLRFLTVNNIYKILLLTSGMIAGWFII